MSCLSGAQPRSCELAPRLCEPRHPRPGRACGAPRAARL